VNEGLVITLVSTPTDLLTVGREHIVGKCDFGDAERKCG
jgi:hypothetical protein